MSEPTAPLVIWRLTDDKPGHMNQTLGLANALARLTPCERHDLPALPRGRALLDLVLGRFPPGTTLPAPDLILGAGHATHLALLAARRAYGGRAVLLMRPSLPRAWFDLCLIPEHDLPARLPAAHLKAPPPEWEGWGSWFAPGTRGGPPPGIRRGHVISTLGVLNAIPPGGPHHPDRCLILIGGPSAHYRWDGPTIARSIRGLVAARPEVRFILTDSRRSPAGFLDSMADLPSDRVELHSHISTPPGWVAGQLAEAGTAWVTEDSVSMVYEALTSGCTVGLLRLPRKGASRVARGVDLLLSRRVVTTADKASDGPGTTKGEPFDEAGRCARHILAFLARYAPVIAP